MTAICPRSPYCRRYSLVVSAALFTLISQVTKAQIAINEIEYDQDGPDTGDYVELKGPAGMSLNGWQLVAYNGADGQPYATFDLASAGNMPADTFLVIGPAGVPNVDVVSPFQDWLENGAPDGLALIHSGMVIEAIAYEGSFTATTGPAAGEPFLSIGVFDIDPDSMIDEVSLQYLCDAECGWTQTPGGTPGLPNTDTGPLFALPGMTLTQLNQQTGTIDLRRTGGIPPYDFRVLSLPESGTLFDDSQPITGTGITQLPYEIDGDLTWVPSLGFSGVVSFSFDVTDSTEVTSSPAIHEIGAQQNQLVISEIMYAPFGTQRIYEYVEVFNPGPSPVVLATIDAEPPFDDFTINNLGGQTVPPNVARLIVPTGESEDSDEQFRCDWGIEESEIIRVPVTRYEVMETDTRLLIFNTAGHLMDGVDLRNNFAPTPFGASIGIDEDFLLFDTLNTESNDDGFVWSDSDELFPLGDQGIRRSTRGSRGSPLFVPDDLHEFSPTFPQPPYVENQSVAVADPAATITIELEVAPGSISAHWFEITRLPAVGTLADNTGTIIDVTPPHVVTGTLTYTAGSFQTDDSFQFRAARKTGAVSNKADQPVHVGTLTGACCLFDGTCAETTPKDCNSLAGQYLGDFLTCDDVSCDQPPEGACCLPDGNCVHGLSIFQCAPLGGHYQGDDTFCTIIPPCSPDPIGACCRPDGICTITSEFTCNHYDGNYLGDGTTCTFVTCPLTAGVAINEVDYDQPGFDSFEFIEIFGPPGESLQGWRIALYDGNPASLAPYRIIDLDAVIPTDGFLVLGHATVPNVDIVTFTSGTGEIQNGGSQGDGIVLLDDSGAVVDGFGYEGSFAAVAPPAVGYFFEEVPAEDDGSHTIARIPNSSGAITELATPTPGLSNEPPDQPIGACCVDSSGYCAIATAQTCAVEFDGQYIGNNTTCEDLDPPCGFVPTGACCRPSGTCTEDLTQLSCQSDFGGVYQGDDTSCDDIPPCPPAPTGACCFFLGNCEGLPQFDCEDTGGTYRGDGEPCASADCPIPHNDFIFISEYYESEPNSRKALELFNASDEPFSLDGYGLALWSNLNGDQHHPNAIQYFTEDDIIPPMSTFVVANNSVDVIMLDPPVNKYMPAAVNFTGDDAIALISPAGTIDIIDIFGKPGEGDFGIIGPNPHANRAYERRPNIAKGVREFLGFESGTFFLPPFATWAFEGFTGVGESPENHTLGQHDFQGCTGAAFGDQDGDGDVDLLDFGAFQICFTGQDGPVIPPQYDDNCQCFDADQDGDVDLLDFGDFQLRYTG
jgi:hypothetical protein